jgi:hypothetical protein
MAMQTEVRMTMIGDNVKETRAVKKVKVEQQQVLDENYCEYVGRTIPVDIPRAVIAEWADRFAITPVVPVVTPPPSPIPVLRQEQEWIEEGLHWYPVHAGQPWSLFESPLTGVEDTIRYYWGGFGGGFVYISIPLGGGGYFKETFGSSHSDEFIAATMPGRYTGLTLQQWMTRMTEQFGGVWVFEEGTHWEFYSADTYRGLDYEVMFY